MILLHIRANGTTRILQCLDAERALDAAQAMTDDGAQPDGTYFGNGIAIGLSPGRRCKPVAQLVKERDSRLDKELSKVKRSNVHPLRKVAR